MSLRKYSLFAAAALALFAAVSCHKDDEEETLPFISVAPEFEMPEYLNPGQKVFIDPGYPDIEGLSDYGVIVTSTLAGIKDTIKFEGRPGAKTFDFVAPDTLASGSLVVSYYAEGYYNSTCTAVYTVVDPAFGRTITGDGFDESTVTFSDSRDGNAYPYGIIDGTAWMFKNLGYDKSGVAFADSEAMNMVYGRFYSFEEAKSACPGGWRLPSLSEWEALMNAADNNAGDLMANAYFNGTRMWEYWPQVKITNALGFAAIPTGYGVRGYSENEFAGNNDYAVFWTATEDEKDSDRAISLYFHEKSPSILKASSDKESFLATVRCIKEFY